MTRKHILIKEIHRWQRKMKRSQKRKAKVIEQLTDAYLLGHHVFIGYELTSTFLYSRELPEHGEIGPRQIIFEWNDNNTSRQYYSGSLRNLIQPDEAKKLIDDNWYRRTYKHKASIS